MEQVSWEEAVEFCARLAEKTGELFHLASEAEWEYACRAGTTTPFHFGETITANLVNCDGTYPYGKAAKGQYREQTAPVGSFPPNAFGLYDLHGNVLEWCADPWHDNYRDAPVDGSVWATGGDSDYRVVRGGSWYNQPVNCRAANRNHNRPDYCNNSNGFRVVCSVFPALFSCQNWAMGIVRAYPEESRPVPVRKATTSENQPEPESLVGASRSVFWLLSIFQ